MERRCLRQRTAAGDGPFVKTDTGRLHLVDEGAVCRCRKLSGFVGVEFVGDVFHVLTTQLNAFLAKGLGDFVTGVRSFLRGEEETTRGSDEGAA